ncbi:hypothetical protein [Shouchella lonarensis]|uniref:Uncharacterized protein n=1 Tax=Shouchella lonarensis TaxID=1464122 RepID=A0A1G6NI26_9BACI|nr:hypothetical protein [Shouchella lonarensis]SDC66996.1 hypothetical protein SAMN05421737_11276 [Shouchella lonarensis]
MTAIWNDFDERAKMIVPIWSFGKGMRIGEELESYKENILFAVLLTIFERELNDDGNRKSIDVEMIARDVLIDMNLDASEDQVRRIATGLLWNGDAKQQNPFSSSYYHPASKQFKHMEYRYLEDDRLYSRWEEGGDTVYKLSEISQNLIFISREMQEELSIDIEQLYSLQLIRNGNFSRASRRIQDLRTRVKVLVNRERETQRELIQNPKLLLSEEFERRGSQEQEIRNQFKEEEKNFQEIQRQLGRVKKLPEHQDSVQIIDEILDDVEDSRRLHDKLAKLYIETFDIQLELRIDHTEKLWNVSTSSLKKDIYEDLILAKGILNAETMMYIIEPLFSPTTEFMLPLEWTWEVHEFSLDKSNIDEGEETDNENEEVFEVKTIDWEQIARAWKPVFKELLEKGQYHIEDLANLSLDEKESWFEQKETFDLWMIFSNEDFFVEPIYLWKKYDDDRMCLVQALIRLDDKFKALVGKGIICELDKDHEFEWNKKKITSRRLVLGRG